MNWKKRLTNYNFWISIVSAVLLILQAFDINFDIAYINEIVTAVLGLLVVIGIINDPTKTSKDTTSSNQENNNSSNTAKSSSANLETEKQDVSEAENDDETFASLSEANQVTEDAENTEIVMPNENENENNISNSTDDYEILVNKIYSDLTDMKVNLEKLYSDSKLQIYEKNLENTENSINIQEKTDENMQFSENFDNSTEKNENSNNDEIDVEINAVEGNDETNIETENNFLNNGSSDNFDNSYTQTSFKIVND